MKILHTSDWHLGQMFDDTFDRTEEYRQFFSQLKDIISKEKPDALLVSGDIFNHAYPSAAAQKLYTDNVISLKRACPSMEIIITAGNHDSASLLEAGGELWKIAGVNIIGSIGRDSDVSVHAERHIIPVGGKDSPKGYVVAIPFCYPRNYPLMNEDIPTAERENVFIDALLSEVKKMNTESLPVVLMMHTTVKGCDFSDKGSIGGIDTMDAAKIKGEYDYLALGHIHTPQTIGKARYCGSPIPISFSEEFTHSVSLVELPSHGLSPIIREEVIHPLFEVITLPKEPTDVKGTIDEIKKLSKKNAYLRIKVKCDSFIPSIEQQKIKDAVPFDSLKLCQIVPVRENEKSADMVNMSVQELLGTDPVDIAARHYKAKYGTDLPDNLKDMLKSIYTATINEK